MTPTAARYVTIPNGAGFLMTQRRPTRATLRRLIRRAVELGEVDAGDPIGAAAWVRGYLRGRAHRSAAPL